MSFDHSRYALTKEKRGSNDPVCRYSDDDWYKIEIPRKEFKQFLKRSDAKALRFFGLWIFLLIVSGSAAYLAWGSYWAIPAFAIYGFLYSASSSRAHELKHMSMFKTRWMNEAFFHLCSFMTLEEGIFWRWSHTQHHSHTIVVGIDPEIQVPRPPNIWRMMSGCFMFPGAPLSIVTTFRHAFGNINAEEKTFIPEADLKRVVWHARIYAILYTGLLVWCIAIGSILPAMFCVLPAMYGGCFTQLFNLTQHAGLVENVPDHRQNCRTVILNPVFRFLYSNMNYHVEHHMFPLVPFYNLPALHERIQADCPPPYNGLFEAYSEIIPTVLKQRKDPSYFVKRPQPEPPTSSDNIPGPLKSVANN